jgi:hypothetical protein
MQTFPITFTVTASQAWALAQFVKRAGLSDYRVCAVDELESHLMLEAGEQLRRALAQEGYTRSSRSPSRETMSWALAPSAQAST